MFIAQRSTTKEIDASLLACKLLAAEALLSFASALLLFLLAGMRVAAALATFILFIASFILWCLSIWQKATEALLSLLAREQINLRGNYHDE